MSVRNRINNDESGSQDSQDDRYDDTSIDTPNIVVFGSVIFIISLMLIVINWIEYLSVMSVIV